MTDIDELVGVITDFFNGAQEPDVDPKMLLEVVYHLPGAPRGLGPESMQEVTGDGLRMARAVGALLYLACDDEIQRRIMAG